VTVSKEGPVLSGSSFETLSAAPQDEGLQSAPLAVMAGLVPAIPIRRSETSQLIEITGTRPMMTWWELDEA
jgi:hypothetical protein